MGASFYGRHLVWHSGMTEKERQQRKDFIDDVKRLDAERDDYQDAKVNAEAQKAVEGR